MRKLFILILLVTSGAINSYAQTSTSGFTNYFSAGPRLGVNFSDISGFDNSEMKAGLLVGAFAVYSFQEHFGVSLDLLYSREGAKYKTTVTSPGFTFKSDVKARLNYLRIPLQACVFFGQFGDALRPKISLGPDLGFLLSAENKSTTTTNDGLISTEESSTKDSKDSFKSTDFGAIAGAGFNLRITEETWFNFDLRYYIGASDIRDEKPAGTDDVKNSNLSVSAGIAFGF
ncbi:MAG: porin family protein [Bacteroidota bacterium]